MIRLKKKYGKLQAGRNGIIDHKTSEERILKLVKQRPELKMYFEGFKKDK